MTGVDIAQKGPWASALPKDFKTSSFFRRVPIFDHTDQTKKFVSTRGSVHCSATFKQTSWESLKDYLYSSSRSSISSVSFGYQGPEVTGTLEAGAASIEVTPVPNSVNIGAGTSDSSSNMETFFEKEGGSISRSKIACTIYEIAIDITHPDLQLHSGFISAIKDLDKAETEEEKAVQMKLFIDNFGTHYGKNAIMGVGSEFETR